MADGKNSHLNFTRRPKDNDALPGWELKRPGARGRVTAVLLSHDIIGHDTHYWGGRTRPCTGETCDACRANNATRWHGYLAATDEGLQARWIIEITAPAANQIDRIFRERRTLRGFVLILERRNQKPNGPISVKGYQGVLQNDKLPDCPDMIKKLCRIWEVHDVGVPRIAKTDAHPLKIAGDLA